MANAIAGSCLGERPSEQNPPTTRHRPEGRGEATSASVMCERNAETGIAVNQAATTSAASVANNPTKSLTASATGFDGPHS